MQVQSVNTQNNQTSFGAIFKPKDMFFNKIQESVANKIKKSMRKPSQFFNGETAEDFYKSKGFDFEIAPHNSKSVYLTAYKDMKEIGNGADGKRTYSHYVRIGEYDTNYEFRVSDIATEIKCKKWSNNVLFGILIVGVCGLLSAIGFNVKQSQNTKPLIENIDSIANKAKTVLPDTTAVSTKILKAIKK